MHTPGAHPLLLLLPGPCQQRRRELSSGAKVLSCSSRGLFSSCLVLSPLKSPSAAPITTR